MNHSENVDHDAVLRARTMLLGSGGLALQQEVEAYRVLADVGPLTYLPRLSRALVWLSQDAYRDQPEACLALRAEAVEAARRLDENEPARTELLVDALRAYQQSLYALGRRAEGFSVREEMACVGRRGYETGQVESPAYGLGSLAAALAEEGRHRESAEAYGQIVDAERPRPGGVSFWTMVDWTTQLDAAGLPDEALAAFKELVDHTRARLEEGWASLATLIWDLVHYSRMLDARGRCDDAHEARREVDTLLSELAETGERKSWSCILPWWTALFVLSDKEEDEGQAAPDGLAERIAAQRRLTIDAAKRWGSHHHRFLASLRPSFDEGVELARRLAELDERCGTPALVRALTDRSALLVAGKSYAEALADFREAAALRPDRTRTSR
ncbi:hypothetical protein [Streptomyces netropsis]|uniref:Tetratricopeptide (TPR) repeat protein n=1 Tax=Streptomyces netropsis TaxID=55404 RepID=A0A7W7L922_STRNE|nr:hypothetical protein [Streptomyces netropsis]MBB4885704.1 tetratricopeptide (TPR) repeat protein [Streptomyces netropsis]GGR36659.1 hypothetical protein GCM10010219_47050 [Streptomyces netropsis]